MYTMTYKVILGLGFVNLGTGIVIRNKNRLDGAHGSIGETFSTGKFPSPFSNLFVSLTWKQPVQTPL